MPPHLTPSEGFYDPISENSRQLHHRQPFKKKVYETPEMPPPSPPPPLHQQFVNFLGWFLVSMDTAASLLWKEAS